MDRVAEFCVRVAEICIQDGEFRTRAVEFCVGADVDGVRGVQVRCGG